MKIQTKTKTEDIKEIDESGKKGEESEEWTLRSDKQAKE